MKAFKHQNFTVLDSTVLNSTVLDSTVLDAFALTLNPPSSKRVNHQPASATLLLVKSKKDRRKSQLAQRIALSPAQYKRSSAAITNHLLSLPEIINATNIHCFWPITQKREPNIEPFISQISDSPQNIVLPVMLTFDAYNDKTQRLAHRMYAGETNLHTNRWGIKEPVTTTDFPLDQLDVVIVPALSVDLRGFRLGYGKGYYDEFLAQCDCPFICPLYSFGVVDSLPTMPHDIPVDIIVTEKEVIRIKP